MNSAQVDIFDALESTNLNLASPEVQQDLFEVDPDAWRRKA